jgi:outer membrane protein assembly factor BamB
MKLPEYELGERSLRKTKPLMRGTDVRKLQQYLKALGFLKGRVDGIFGDETEKALKEFQRVNNLKPTGIWIRRGGSYDPTIDEIKGLFADRYIDWQVYQKNPQHTGFTPFKISLPLKEIRKIKIPGDVKIIAFNNRILAWTPEGLYCIQSNSGRLSWKKEIKGISHYPCADNNSVFVPLENELTALNIKKGSRLWSFTSDEELTFSPLPFDGKIIIGTKGEITALDQLSGRKLWSYTGPDVFYSQPAAADGLIAAGGYNRMVYGISADTGQVIWKIKCHDIIKDPPVIEKNRVYITAGERRFYSINRETGEFEWKAIMGRGDYFSPAVWNEKLFYSSRDGTLCSLDGEKGTVRWVCSLSAPVTAPPIITKDNMLVGTEDGLKAIDLTEGKVQWEGLQGNKINSIGAFKYSIIASASGYTFIFSGI